MAKSPQSRPDAAETAEDEANLVHVDTDGGDLKPGEKLLNIPLAEEENVTIRVGKRWKRFKFMRAIGQMDLLGALELIGATDEQIDTVAEAEVSEEEFEATIEALATALVGSSGKTRSSGSPRS